MKKLTLILLTATLLLSCSAERRLAVFLARHPELQYIDTIHVRDSIILPEEKAVAAFTLQDLSELQDKTSANATQSKNTTSPTIEVETKASKATITANPDGSFNLQATQKPDTIYRDKYIKVPSYHTRTITKDKIVHELTPWQDFWVKLGQIGAVFALLAIAIRLVQKYA